MKIIRLVYVLSLLLVINVECIAQFLYLEAEVINASPTANCENGEIDLKINGAIPPFDIIWSFQDFDPALPPSNLKVLTESFARRNIEDLRELSPGYYTVFVNDRACSSISASFTINCECIECKLIESIDSLDTSTRREFLSIAESQSKETNIEYYKFLYANYKFLESKRERILILNTIIRMPIKEFDYPFFSVVTIYIDAMTELIELNKNNLNELYVIKVQEDLRYQVFPILKEAIENAGGYWGRGRIPNSPYSYPLEIPIPGTTFRSEEEIAIDMNNVPVKLKKELPGRYYSEFSELVGFSTELILKKNGRGQYQVADNNKFKFSWKVEGDSIYLSNVREIFENKSERYNSNSYLFFDLTVFRVKIDPPKSMMKFEIKEDKVYYIYSRKRRRLKVRFKDLDSI